MLSKKKQFSMSFQHKIKFMIKIIGNVWELLMMICLLALVRPFADTGVWAERVIRAVGAYAFPEAVVAGGNSDNSLLASPVDFLSFDFGGIAMFNFDVRFDAASIIYKTTKVTIDE